MMCIADNKITASGMAALMAGMESNGSLTECEREYCGGVVCAVCWSCGSDSLSLQWVVTPAAPMPSASRGMRSCPATSKVSGGDGSGQHSHQYSGRGPQPRPRDVIIEMRPLRDVLKDSVEVKALRLLCALAFTANSQLKNRESRLKHLSRNSRQILLR